MLYRTTWLIEKDRYSKDPRVSGVHRFFQGVDKLNVVQDNMARTTWLTEKARESK
jgi:hypothetical protein